MTTEERNTMREQLFNFAGLKHMEGQIHTPRKIAKQMIDSLPDSVWNADTTFLDPATKSGVFLLEIYKKLMNSSDLLEKFPDPDDREQHILQNQLFGIATDELGEMFIRRMMYLDSDINNIVYLGDYIKKSSESIGETLKKEFNGRMKFDVVIGNPPYQESTGEGKQAKPLYHLFVKKADEISSRYSSMIIPSRWLNGGIGLDEFRHEMLNCNNIKYMKDFSDANKVFGNVLISGGVLYYLRDKAYSGECEVEYVADNSSNKMLRYLNGFDTYVRDNRAVSIIEKVGKEKSIENKMSSLNPFGIEANMRGNELPEEKDSCKLLSSGGVGYIELNEVKKGKEYLKAYKTIVAKALSSAKGKVFGTIETLGKNEVCTFSYFIAGCFDNEIEADNLKKYLKTKIVRFMVFQTAVSINISKKNFCFVPLQDFTSASDIDWSQSVSDIDKQLYSKYSLSDDEIKYIESTIKPME